MNLTAFFLVLTYYLRVHSHPRVCLSSLNPSEIDSFDSFAIRVGFIHGFLQNLQNTWRWRKNINQKNPPKNAATQNTRYVWFTSCSESIQSRLTFLAWKWMGDLTRVMFELTKQSVCEHTPRVLTPVPISEARVNVYNTIRFVQNLRQTSCSFTINDHDVEKDYIKRISVTVKSPSQPVEFKMMEYFFIQQLSVLFFFNNNPIKCIGTNRRLVTPLVWTIIMSVLFFGFRYPGHGMDVEKALSGCSEERPIVLLAHQPHAAKQALQQRPDINLVLSGTRSDHTSLHTHSAWIICLRLFIIHLSWVYIFII